MTNPPSHKKLNILIVDDEEEICFALQEILEIQGWQTQVCHNGFDALAITKDNSVDIVISDIRMPKCTGYDFLEKLDPELKEKMDIVMISAYSDYDEEQLKKVGASKLLPKPLNGSHLINYINSVQLKK